MRALILSLIVSALSCSLHATENKAIKNVVLVIFENASYKSVMKDPYFKALSKKGVQLTNMFAETHPSQGNYIALVSGSVYGVRNDKNITLDERHLGDLLEEKGLNWKVYAEGFPGNCFLGNKGKYVRKHVPFISFKNIQDSPERCARIVNSAEFKADVAQNTLP